MRTEPTPSAGARDMREHGGEEWVLILRREREGTGPHVVEVYRRNDVDGITVSLDRRRTPASRWNWARTYKDGRGRLDFVRGHARSRAAAFEAARSVAP
jgi:hypothetical protein